MNFVKHNGVDIMDLTYVAFLQCTYSFSSELNVLFKCLLDGEVVASNHGENIGNGDKRVPATNGEICGGDKTHIASAV